MSMLMYAALNPNLNAQQFAALAEQHVASFERMCKCVRENAETLKTPEEKTEYMMTVFPILMMLM